MPCTALRKILRAYIYFLKQRRYLNMTPDLLEWQPAFKLQILTFQFNMPLAFELSFNSAQGALLLTFL